MGVGERAGRIEHPILEVKCKKLSLPLSWRKSYAMYVGETWIRRIDNFFSFIFVLLR